MLECGIAHSVPYLLLRMTAEEEPHSNGATVRDKLGKRLALDEKGDCGTLLIEALDDEENTERELRHGSHGSGQGGMFTETTESSSVVGMCRGNSRTRSTGVYPVTLASDGVFSD